MSTDMVLSLPRKIDPAKTFDAIVSWIEHKSVEEHAPGLIVGISGTDSILTFLASYRAFERLGKAGKVLGLNFEHETKNEFAGKDELYTCVSSDFNWVARDIFPWLKEQTLQALLETDSTIPHSDENMRWGHLLSRAVKSTDRKQGLNIDFFFPVGTRNATEQALGTYSQISKSVSMLPILDLYKSEVIEICEYLGVPQIAIDKSREIDCDCGRFDVQANHMRELDLYIMERKGQLSRDFLATAMPAETLNAVREFYVEETYRNGYRLVTPHVPTENLVVCTP